MTKRLLSLLLAAGMLLSVTACSSQSTPSLDVFAPTGSSQAGSSLPLTSSDPLELTLAAYAEQSFHPTLSSSRTNLTLAPLMYEGLFELDDCFSPQPVLCRDWSVENDGLTWIFLLHDGVTFSDGTPLTAALAAAALELARTDSTYYAGRFACVSSIAADKDGRLVINLKYPNADLPALLDVPIALGRGSRPLGTGPYTLESGQDGSLYLAARSDWWQQKAVIQPTIPLICVSRTDELVDAFSSGRLTLINADLTSAGAPGYSGTADCTDYATTSLVYLAFNTQQGLFRSAAARQGAAAALDRDALVASAYAGHATAALLPLHPSTALYQQITPPDPDTQALISSAGLAGRSVTLIVNNENICKVAAAQLIARQLEAAGLTVTVSRLPWDDYVSALNKGQYDLYLAQAALTADFDLTSLVGRRGSLNYAGWSSDTADALLSAFLAADSSARPQVAQQLYDLLAREAPIVPLCFQNGSVLTPRSGVTGMVPTRGNVFYQMDQWALLPTP